MRIYVVIGALLAVLGALVGVFAIQAEQARAEAALAAAQEARAQNEGRQNESRWASSEDSGEEARREDSVADALRELGREVGALRQAVEELQGTPLREPVEEESANAASDRPALRRELAQLESSMREEFKSLRALIELGERHALVDAIRSDKRHVDWSAWEEVIAAWRRSPEEARKLVKLLTSDELIERFGPPTDIWANQMGLTWQYERDHPIETDLTQEIILRLPDGFVAQLAVRELKKKSEDG